MVGCCSTVGCVGLWFGWWAAVSVVRLGFCWFISVVIISCTCFAFATLFFFLVVSVVF